MTYLDDNYMKILNSEVKAEILDESFDIKKICTFKKLNSNLYKNEDLFDSIVENINNNNNNISDKMVNCINIRS